MTCPFPHTRRDQTWLAVGVALGLGIMYLSAPNKVAPPDMSSLAPAPGGASEDTSASSVRHVVLLQLKDEIPEDVLNNFVAAAKELPSKIPQIMSYSVGLDLGLKSATPNHPIAITGLFKDKYDYEVRWDPFV